MPNSAPNPSSERELIDEIARTRGARLARVVGISFGGLLLLALLAMTMAYFIQPASFTPAFRSIASTLIQCVGLYAIAIWLSYAHHELAAGFVIVGSTLYLVFMLQAARVAAQGLDVVAMALFVIYLIVIGLAGLLANRPTMFAATVICNLVAALVCFSLAGNGLEQIDIVVAFLIVIGVQWAVALLYFTASSLYDKTLSELGNLREAYERAKRLDELKDQFITNVNHELRNPIMALYNYIDTIRLAGTGMTNDMRTKLLDKAVEMGDRVITLLKSILDVRRLDDEQREITFQAINVQAIVQEAAGSIELPPGHHAAHPLHLNIPATLSVWGDRTMLQEVLINLLANAQKYSGAGTPIEVQATIISPTAGEKSKQPTARVVEIAIRDHGLGIPPEQISLLFERFVRLPRDLTSAVPGNGLGLYLCRVFVTKMNGKIWVVSRGIPGQGSIFYIHLPLPPYVPLPDAPTGIRPAVRV